MKLTLKSRLAVGIATLAMGVSSQAMAQATAEQSDENVAASEDDEEGDSKIVVVGSRLEQGDVTANTRVITSESIEARGLTTAEEIIRTIPENFSSINGANNLDNDADLDVGLGDFGLGISTANLRGIGSGNTLVLVNGRRISGAAGQPEFFANLRDIPASAIERVEVNLDGGSAVYGSDAVAGTINIVLKRGYSGGQISAFQEFSETGADRFRISGNYGFSWGSGDASFSASYTESDPIIYAKAGFTTLDYTDIINDPRADFRATDFGGFTGVRGTGQRGALICDPFTAPFGCSPFGPFNSILPTGNNGTRFTLDQLQPVAVGDFEGFIPREATGFTKDYSFSASLSQQLGSIATLTIDGLYTNAMTKRRVDQIPLGNFTVPASNAFNLTGQDVFVSYDPSREFEAGLIDLPQQSSESEFWSISPGIKFSLSKNVTLTLEYSHSESQSFNEQFAFSPTLSPFSSGNEPPEILAENARLAAILADRNPATAPNLFGDGSVQNASIAEFLVPIADRSGTSTLDTYIGYLRGGLTKLPGGNLDFVLGGEYRIERFGSAERSFGTTTTLDLYGVTTPERKLFSGFAEVSVPIFGEDNARPGLQRLVFSGQLRYDEYSLRGADGLDDNFEPIIVDTQFDNLTTSLGLLWSPTNNLDARFKFSEGFRAPNTSDIFTTFAGVFTFPVYDPLNEVLVVVPYTFGSNLGLRPERSSNYSAGLTFRPFGNDSLILEANYSYLDFKDRIASAFELDRLLGAKAFGSIAEIFIRDESGTLIAFNDNPINISRRVSENLDFSVSGRVETDFGTFRPSLFVNYVIGQFDQAAAGGNRVDSVGDIRGRDRYNVIGNLDWQYGPWRGALLGTFTPGYKNTNFEDPSFSRFGLPTPDVDSRFVLDLSLGYRFDFGLRINVGSKNLLGADFPFALSRAGVPFDTRRVDLRGRTFFLNTTFEF